MVAGYINEDAEVFCTDCWRAHAEAGARPSQVLDSENPDDAGSKFWVVDVCTACARQVKHKAAMALN